MHIQFETSTLTPDETLGLIAFLETLLPVNEQYNQAVPGPHIPAPSPTTEKQAIFGVPVQATPTDAPTPSAEPTPIDEAPKRKRRTKAEIEADEAAAAKAAAAPAEPTLQTAIESTTESPKPITKEILTELTNGYIARHSMEEALAILKTTGCQRLSEAMAMEPAKLAELAEKLRG